MPRFEVTELVRTRELHAIRAICDGCDPARPCDEHVREARLWLVMCGAFQLRDRRGVHVLDPSRALLMPAGHEFVIRHPAGPDVCVAIHGPLVAKLAGEARLTAIRPAQIARITAELAAYQRDEGDEIGLAEAIADLADADPHEDRELGGSRSSSTVGRGSGSSSDGATLDPGSSFDGRSKLTRGSRADRDLGRFRADRDLIGSRADRDLTGSRADCDLVAAVEQVVRLDFAGRTSLSELAERTGYSLFHACRVFRATTGQTIAGFRRELRLRHALARILDGDESLAQISEACGFATQSHLTNLFRARFGITPARARTRDGIQRLCA